MRASRLRRFGSLIGSLIIAALALALLVLAPWWLLLAGLLLVALWTLSTRVGSAPRGTRSRVLARSDFACEQFAAAQNCDGGFVAGSFQREKYRTH